VRGVQRKGRTVTGARALVVGCGGVGSAIAAALAKAGAAQLALCDTLSPTMDSLAERLQTHYPKLKVDVGSADPAGFDIVVNATPLGMRADDPLPINVDRIAPSTFVGEVVLKQEITPLLAAVRARGCEFQIGTDMLFEQIPAHLEFFGFGLTTAEELRGLTEINY
jgi:shikimate dehydrogenase